MAPPGRLFKQKTIAYFVLLPLSLAAIAIIYARTATMSTQTALVVTEVGGRVKSVSNWPVPQPGPGQVQLRVGVAGLNPHDQKSRDRGLFIEDSLPAILANDITGIVTTVGADVTKFKVGDRVVSQSSGFQGNLQKPLQQYAVVDQDFAAKIPEGVSEHEAATLPTNVIAALFGLFDSSGLGIPAPWSSEAASFDYAGASLLIVGGGANCGRFGVQLAKLAGIGKIVVIGGDEKELKQWGATHVLDRHAADAVLVKQIRDIVGDELLYAFDVINPPEGQHLAISALSSSRKGALARLIHFVGKVDESKIIGQKAAGYELRGVLGLSALKPEIAKPFWDRVSHYLKEGKLVAPKYEVVKGLDADKVNEVLDRYRDGKKVVQTHFEVSSGSPQL